MANDIRVRQPGVGGVLSSALGVGVTTMSSTKLAGLPVIDSTNHAMITLYDENGQYETVRVTAHTSGATSATIAAVSGARPGGGWPTATKWRHGPVADDLQFGLVTNAAARTAMTAYQGQTVLQVDTGEDWQWTGSAWRRLGQPSAKDGQGAYGPGIWTTPVTTLSGFYEVKDGLLTARGAVRATGVQTGSGGNKRTTLPYDGVAYILPVGLANGDFIGTCSYFKQGVGLYANCILVYDSVYPGEPYIYDLSTSLTLSPASSNSDYLVIHNMSYKVV